MNFQYKTFKSVEGLETDIKPIRYDYLDVKYERAWPIIDDDFVFYPKISPIVALPFSIQMRTIWVS